MEPYEREELLLMSKAAEKVARAFLINADWTARQNHSYLTSHLPPDLTVVIHIFAARKLDATI
jgi:hypothetical protein